MYSLSDLEKAIEHPIFFVREVNKLYHSRLRTRSFNPAGVDIFEEDWDNLIILDACRYDAFADRATLPGRLESRISRGSTSSEFVRGNFSGVRGHDTVYVTANAWYFKLRDRIDAELHATVYLTDVGFDPAPVTDEALAAAEEYPDKRLIVHYLHPHVPYIGPTAEAELSEYDPRSFLGQLHRRELSIPDDVLRRAYNETLDRVLAEVERLFDSFRGKTVVTADHGELLGDRCFPVPMKDYGHHPKLYVEELVTVPWLIHETGDRRRIVSGTPESGTETDDAVIDERLRQLGYKV